MLRVFNITHHTTELEYEFFKFPGGELHFKFENLPLDTIEYISIEADLVNSDEIILLCLMADYFKCKKELRLMYTPYARQDRVTSRQEPFSFKTFARIINACGFDSVVLHDPHSDVTPALIENCVVVERVKMLPMPLPANIIIVSPDAGAMKANNVIAKEYKCQHICATKIRDVQTGEITETQLHTDIDLKGRSLLILDDICDGGRTFIELAKVLKKHEPRRISLHITVGIFSKGIEVLEEHFDQITYFHKLGEQK